jgi:hypothetical protein
MPVKSTAVPDAVTEVPLTSGYNAPVAPVTKPDEVIAPGNVAACEADSVNAVVPAPEPVLSSNTPVLSALNARPFVALPALIVVDITDPYRTTQREPVGTVITTGDVIDVDDADCDGLTVYVPVPPVPDPNAVIAVPAVIPLPLSTDPIANTPVVAAETVNVVEAILPVPVNTGPVVNGPVDMAFLSVVNV